MNILSWSRGGTAAMIGLLLLCGELSQAYKMKCEGVFTDSLQPSQRTDAPQRVSKAIEQYQKILGLGELTHKPASLDAAKIHYRALSAAQKRSLLEMISGLYNEVKSLKYNQEGPFKTFKRHLDIIISQELNAPQFFREEIYQKGKSLEQALDLYYQKVQILTGIPVLLQGQDVLLTALRLQEKFLTKVDNSIVIYGSFPNGRAYTKTSDLDFAVMNPKLETKMRETDLLGLLTDFPLSEAQAHTIAPGQVHALGYLNPLVLIVRKDYVVLRVYENGLHDDFKNKEVHFDEFYL